MRLLMALATAGLLAWPTAARAQQAGDAARGGRLAATWCANCHVVSRGQAAAPPAAGDAAPTFPAVAAMPSTTAMSLRAFLQTPHRRMPDLMLSREDTDDLVAYILGLRAR
jgi:mono/diheme cytochrome c family protein